MQKQIYIDNKENSANLKASATMNECVVKTMSSADILTHSLMISANKRKVIYDPTTSIINQTNNSVNKILFHDNNTEKITNVDSILHKTSAADILTSSMLMSAKKKKKFDSMSSLNSNSNTNDDKNTLTKKLFITSHFDFNNTKSLLPNNSSSFSSSYVDEVDDSVIGNYIPYESTTEIIDSINNNDLSPYVSVEKESYEFNHHSSPYQSNNDEYDNDSLDYDDNDSLDDDGTNSISSNSINMKDLECLRDRAGLAVVLQIIDILNHGDINQVNKKINYLLKVYF